MCDILFLLRQNNGSFEFQSCNVPIFETLIFLFSITMTSTDYANTKAVGHCSNNLEIDNYCLYSITAWRVKYPLPCCSGHHRWLQPLSVSEGLQEPGCKRCCCLTKHVCSVLFTIKLRCCGSLHYTCCMHQVYQNRQSVYLFRKKIILDVF